MSQSPLMQHSPTSPALAVVSNDLCLAPDGKCACSEKQTAPASAIAMKGPPSACWRVKVPWWTLSRTMLPNNYYEQLAHQYTARERTPSPEALYLDANGQAPSPKLLLAPAEFVEVPLRPYTTKANNIDNTQDVQEKRERSPSRGEKHKRSLKRRPTQPCQIATQLRKLEDADPSSVIMVRSIQRLGFNSSRLLRKHFEAFGLVEEVLLSSSHERTDAEKMYRVRPASSAWVKMSSSAVVAQILEQGEKHMVAGFEVRVCTFRHRFERQDNSLTDVPPLPVGLQHSSGIEETTWSQNSTYIADEAAGQTPAPVALCETALPIGLLHSSGIEETTWSQNSTADEAASQTPTPVSLSETDSNPDIGTCEPCGEEQTFEPLSVGSIGHPHTCASACKYITKQRGCLDGADCLRCHLCKWKSPKKSDKTSKKLKQKTSERLK